MTLLPDPESWLDLDPDELTLADRYQTMLAGVSPRPIAFVSSLDAEGRSNLAPFSYFNAFGSTPPVVGVSPALDAAVRQKDTLKNVLASSEYTISVVTHAMAARMNIASFEYAPGVDEFVKSGFSKLPSRMVRPPAVAESPFILECRLLQHVPLGQGPGSGNLLLGQVVLFRVRREVYDDQGRIDPAKLDPIGRLGRHWYTRTRDGLFQMKRPRNEPRGYDALPESVLRSRILTGSDIARLAATEGRVDAAPFDAAETERRRNQPEEDLHREILALVRTDRLQEAWALMELARSQR